MKALDWSLAQEMIHKKDARSLKMLETRPYGQDWPVHSYYCKKGGHLFAKEDAHYTNGNHRPMCPIHHQLARHHKHRTKRTVDNRKRVDC